MNIKIIQCSFPDAEKARQIGTVLIEKQYAACVKIMRDVESIFVWDKKLTRENEAVMIIKTSSDMVQTVSEKLKLMHPYEVPDIMVIDVTGGNSAYEKWVLDSVSRT